MCRGPLPAGWDRGWGKRHGADESPGASQGGPARPLSQGGGERGLGAGCARLSRLSPPCAHVSLPSGPGGRERGDDGTWVHTGPLQSSLPAPPKKIYI